MACATITIMQEMKRGDTVSLGGSAGLPAGAWTATAKGKIGDLVVTMNVVMSAPVVPGDPWPILITYTGDTSAWPKGIMLVDVKYVDTVASYVGHSPTFGIAIEQEIT